MNMKQLKYVLILAKEHSFARAAEQIGISQPSLSQYIKKIEQQIGMELFYRVGGNVRLTDAGHIYVETGKKILDLEHQMIGQFSDLQENKTGTVTIGTSPYRSASMMPTAVKQFREIYPGMCVIVEEMTTVELMEAMEQGKFDFCVTMLPVNERLFCYEKITEEELMLAVPREMSLFSSEKKEGKRYNAIDIAALDGVSYIALTENQVMQRTLDALCADYNVDLKKVAVVKSLEAQIAMVRAGVGIALVPTGIEAFCATDEVEFYSFKQELPKRIVIAAWRKDRDLNQVSQCLLSIMKQVR